MHIDSELFVDYDNIYVILRGCIIQVDIVKKEFFLGYGLRKIDWDLNDKKYIRINFNTYTGCQ